ncbi:hypothetical protein BCR33DRAFT_211405 [Rhizoclosmatium globosum]|uniref:Uncharacterized protein n=1 Tax=Rhizoclosmatium globosum TaxID=329046 RepID=A0A1Y2CD88_9FUNG|nr:hypothetical protein BCR33DRAFT_211405 [Rhizoclosmatium globosum]|eukprot:ORY44867.1 hypothetical protein BCR33DRAFT_211405 [Rhizoclosmatium globosum]
MFSFCLAKLVPKLAVSEAMASSSSSSSCCPPQPTAVSKSVLVTLGPEDHTFNLHSSMRSVLRTVGEITQLYTMIKHKHSSLCFSILAPVKSSDVEVERAGVQRFLDTVTSIPNLTSDKDVQSFFESEFSFSPDFQITALMAPLHRSASQFAISVFVAQKEASDCDAQISILRTHIELVKEVFANLEQKIDLFITCSSEYEAVLIDLDSHLHEEAVLSDIRVPCSKPTLNFKSHNFVQLFMGAIKQLIVCTTRSMLV